MIREQLNDDKKVTIIMPAYNAEKYIGESIESVMKQSYKNWELIVIDDFSIDHTCEIVQSYSNYDHRIKLIECKKNHGAAYARNLGTERAAGDYIAFLDSDDLWHKEKLLKQIAFMVNNKYAFTATSYGKISDDGQKLNKHILVPKRLSYKGVLKHSMGNSTVIYNNEILGKVFAPDIKKRNDYALFLKIVKISKVMYGLNDELAFHRLTIGSLSSNKFSLPKYHWLLYRKIEKLSFIYSLYLSVYWIIKTLIAKIFK